VGWMGRTGVTAAAAVFAFTAGMSLHEGRRGEWGPAVASGAQLSEIQRGEATLRASCQACHERRVIEVQAMSFEEWTGTIHKMIDMGASVPADDIPLLAQYLTIFHGPVPDGPGREILLNTCTMCHDLMRIKSGRRTAEEWEEALILMFNEGAPLSDEDFVLIHHYLSRNFNIE
jgi:cytochrome c5